MKFTAATIAVASFASPFSVVLLVPDAESRQGLMNDWFYGIPAEVLAVAPCKTTPRCSRPSGYS